MKTVVIITVVIICGLVIRGHDTIIRDDLLVRTSVQVEHDRVSSQLGSVEVTVPAQRAGTLDYVEVGGVVPLQDHHQPLHLLQSVMLGQQELAQVQVVAALDGVL